MPLGGGAGGVIPAEIIASLTRGAASKVRSRSSRARNCFPIVSLLLCVMTMVPQRRWIVQVLIVRADTWIPGDVAHVSL